MAKEIAELAKGLLNDPVRVEAQPPATTVGTLDQRVILSGSKQKRDELNKLLADPALKTRLIFSRTKHGADRVTKNLAIDGHEAAAIHGNKSQNARQAALKGFASGKVRILVATDIAARGIDVPNITHVINYELPDDAENYVHRIGRTARNGASGFAITLCDGTERGKLRDVERLIRRTLPVTGEIKAGRADRAEGPDAASRPGSEAGGRPPERPASAAQCRPAFLRRQEGGDHGRAQGRQRQAAGPAAEWPAPRRSEAAARQAARDGVKFKGRPPGRPFVFPR